MRGHMRKAVHVRAIANSLHLGAHRACGVLRQIRLAHGERLLMHPHHLRAELLHRMRQLIRPHQHVAAAQINLVFQLHRNRHRIHRRLQVAVKRHNRLHPRLLPRRQRDHSIALMQHTARNLSAKSAKISIRPQHQLHRKPQRRATHAHRHRNSLQILQQRRPRIPRHIRAGLHHVVPGERADRNHLHALQPKMRGKRKELLADRVVLRLVVANQVHLVHRSHYMRNAQQRCNKRMPPRLREHALRAVDQHNRHISRRRARCHIARVLLMSRRIRDDELALGRRKIPVRHINRDALLAFSAKAIRQQRKINRPSSAVDAALLNGSELVLIHRFGVMQQPPDQG